MGGSGLPQCGCHLMLWLLLLLLDAALAFLAFQHSARVAGTIVRDTAAPCQPAALSVWHAGLVSSLCRPRLGAQTG